LKRKNDQVYNYLHALIGSGELPPGARIKNDQIAVRLGVSPIPVREALSRLEAEGFVVIEPHVGARVGDLHEGRIGEVFDLLSELELICARAACLRFSESDLKRLEAHVVQMAEYAYDPEAWALSNRELHLFIAECSGQRLTAQLLRTTLDHWNRIRRHFVREVFIRRIPSAQAEHEKLLAAFRKRDVVTVERLVRTHNAGAVKAYLEHLHGGQAAPTAKTSS
jgi:DNA-binding GntR family transcriptional regulator